MFEYTPQIRLIPFPGFPSPFWFRHMKLVKEIIKKYGMKELEPEEKKAFFPFPNSGTAGGDRGPHFHLGDKIYIAQPEQWKLFTSSVFEQLQKGLQSARTVSPNMVEIQNADEVVSALQR